MVHKKTMPACMDDTPEDNACIYGWHTRRQWLHVWMAHQKTMPACMYVIPEDNACMYGWHTRRQCLHVWMAHQKAMPACMDGTPEDNAWYSFCSNTLNGTFGFINYNLVPVWIIFLDTHPYQRRCITSVGTNLPNILTGIPESLLEFQMKRWPVFSNKRSTQHFPTR